MLIVMMVGLIVVRMIIMLLIFGHLCISLMVLSSIHHHMLSLMSVMTVHIEGVVTG